MQTISKTLKSSLFLVAKFKNILSLKKGSYEDFFLNFCYHDTLEFRKGYIVIFMKLVLCCHLFIVNKKVLFAELNDTRTMISGKL